MEPPQIIAASAETRVHDLERNVAAERLSHRLVDHSHAPRRCSRGSGNRPAALAMGCSAAGRAAAAAAGSYGRSSWGRRPGRPRRTPNRVARSRPTREAARGSPRLLRVVPDVLVSDGRLPLRKPPERAEDWPQRVANRGQRCRSPVLAVRRSLDLFRPILLVLISGLRGTTRQAGQSFLEAFRAGIGCSVW